MCAKNRAQNDVTKSVAPDNIVRHFLGHLGPPFFHRLSMALGSPRGFARALNASLTTKSRPIRPFWQAQKFFLQKSDFWPRKTPQLRREFNLQAQIGSMCARGLAESAPSISTRSTRNCDLESDCKEKLQWAFAVLLSTRGGSNPDVRVTRPMRLIFMWVPAIPQAYSFFHDFCPQIQTCPG